MMCTQQQEATVNDPGNILVHVMYAGQRIFLHKLIRVDLNELRFQTNSVLVKLISNPWLIN